MPFLFLQTFAWMLALGLIGCFLGCLARRYLAPEVGASDLVPVGTSARTSATAIPPNTGLAGVGPRPVAPPAPAPLPRGPVIAGATAPAPVGLSGRGAGSEAYAYPVTTVGIPRGAPELVQPQIQTINLPTVGAPVAVATAASVAAGAVVAAAKGVVAAPSATSSDVTYPITTVGIPPARVEAPAAVFPGVAVKTAAQGTAPVATVAPVVSPARVDVNRFEDALRGQAQPRPEPLRPELGRAPSQAAPVAPAPVTVAAEPVAPVAPAASIKPAVSSAVASAADVAFTPVAASAAALAALAERAAAATTAPLSPGAATGSDDLTRIRTVDATLQSRLRAAGVVRFADIAKWSPADVARISQTIGTVGRIEQENWIEQAQILATGGDTEYSRRRRQLGDATVPVAPVTAPAASTQASTSVPTLASPNAGAGSAGYSSMGAGGASAAAAAAAAAMAATTAARAGAANASTGVAPPARLSDAIRDNAATAKPVEKPEDKPADTARVSRPDLAGLRSVRSEALRSDATPGDSMRIGGGNRPAGSIEDLKRIRGIGVLIEKKLNSLGVSSYEQVANWTNADIDRVSQILDFKGRIERENWVEQARILASGGHTEFSRRVDRGEA
jgi:predicted flap endonuclease-1-like 5' DNA nuclease